MKTIDKQAQCHSEIEVEHFVDQHGEAWLRISKGASIANLPAKDLVGQNAAQTARQVAVAGGPLAISAAAAKQLKRLVDDAHDVAPTSATVVDRNGWVEELALLVSVHSTLGLEHNGRPLIDARPKNAAHSARGTLLAWKQCIRLVRRNPLLGFALAASFVGPLLPFFLGVGENVGFELEGTTSIGKTSVMRLVASVWGAPADVLGSWDTTAAGLETLMAVSDGTVLLLDEASRAHRGKSVLTQELVLKLSDGKSKTRHGDPAGRPSRFCFLSTSNLSLNHALVATQAEQDAIKARMPSVPARRGEHGVLDQLEEGVGTAAHQIAELTQRLDQNYGLAGPRFAKMVAFRANRRNGRRRVEDLVADLAARFKTLVPAPRTPAEQRVLDKFAIVFAAGHLAYRRGIIPSVTGSVVTIYLSHLAHQAVAQPLLAPIDIVRRYAAEHADALVRVGTTYREYTTAELDSTAGFLKEIGGVQHLLLRRCRTKKLFGPQERVYLEDLRATGKLHATEGLQHQTRVRRNRDHDRFYAIQMADTAWAIPVLSNQRTSDAA